MATSTSQPVELASLLIFFSTFTMISYHSFIWRTGSCYDSNLMFMGPRLYGVPISSFCGSQIGWSPFQTTERTISTVPFLYKNNFARLLGCSCFQNSCSSIWCWKIKLLRIKIYSLKFLNLEIVQRKQQDAFLIDSPIAKCQIQSLRIGFEVKWKCAKIVKFYRFFWVVAFTFAEEWRIMISRPYVACWVFLSLCCWSSSGLPRRCIGSGFMRLKFLPLIFSR